MTTRTHSKKQNLYSLTSIFSALSFSHPHDFNWSPGDRMHLRKVSDSNDFIAQKADSNVVVNSDTWGNCTYWAYKIKIRRYSSKLDEVPKLISIETNDILPTVSK